MCFDVAPGCPFAGIWGAHAFVRSFSLYRVLSFRPWRGEGSPFVFEADGIAETFAFSISDFDRALVEAGGWVDYADAKY